MRACKVHHLIRPRQTLAQNTPVPKETELDQRHTEQGRKKAPKRKMKNQESPVGREEFEELELRRAVATRAVGNVAEVDEHRRRRIRQHTAGHLLPGPGGGKCDLVVQRVVREERHGIRGRAGQAGSDCGTL